ncbi:PQQ-binding-like beta-propeller repeat protein [bacterium]|nr:PQQ-binding-like beta-propeller repeat protein [bacterium]
MAKTMLRLASIGAFTASLLSAADWPQWRGPARNGVAPESPRLAETWAAGGPTCLWTYAAPSGQQGGLGSLVLADGRVYAYVNQMSVQTGGITKLTPYQLQQVGWSGEKIPDDLGAKVEQARLSSERAKTKDEALWKWSSDWIASNVPPAQKKFENIVRERLMLGRKAAAPDVVAKLDTIKNKEFGSAENLAAWYASNGIPDAVSKAINNRKVGVDIFLCLDAVTGAEVWKNTRAGGSSDWGACGTPCVADGRVYICGSLGDAYCFDAATGAEVWKTNISSSATSASFLVHDGLAIVSARPLTALDAKTGRIVWTQKEVQSVENSPLVWKAAGTTNLICNTHETVACVDAASGRVLWKAPGGMYSTPVIEDDWMVLLRGATNIGLAAYKLSTNAATEAWSVLISDRGASPLIHEGTVFAVAQGRMACVELETGNVLWNTKAPSAEISSPILVDGKILAAGGSGTLLMVAASPAEYTLLAKAPLKVAPCTSPCIAGGRLYLRLDKSIACFDLRAQK